MLQRADLLRKSIRTEEQQLVALNVLQELVTQMEQPGCEYLLFVDVDSHILVHLKLSSPAFISQE